MKFFPKTVKRAKRAIGLEEIKENTSYLKYLFTMVFKLGRGKSESSTIDPNAKTFEDLGYTPEELAKTQSSLKKLVFFYLVVLFLSFLYWIDCLVRGYHTTALLMICFMFFCGVLAFRHHFQWFAIRENRLNCSLGEWRKALFQGRRAPK
jgi:intracellular multiplication protein IcmV